MAHMKGLNALSNFPYHQSSTEKLKRRFRKNRRMCMDTYLQILYVSISRQKSELWSGS